MAIEFLEFQSLNAAEDPELVKKPIKQTNLNV